MRPADTARLVALAAIWGASFLFTRIAAPALGPVLTAEARTLIAGIALAIYFGFTGYNPEWRRWGRQYLVVGILTSGLPFLLWAYAALTLTAGLMSVLNATSPMWGALCSAVLLRERLTGRRIVGLLIGMVGVALVTRPEAGTAVPYGAMLAALGAALCYGLAGAYMKRWASARARARHGGRNAAWSPAFCSSRSFRSRRPQATPSLLIIVSMLMLGLICGAIAYLLYFRLVADIGATGALTVTYLIPVFGVLWGALFLGEPLTLPMLAGGVLVIFGTVLVLRTVVGCVLASSNGNGGCTRRAGRRREARRRAVSPARQGPRAGREYRRRLRVPRPRVLAGHRHRALCARRPRLR